MKKVRVWYFAYYSRKTLPDLLDAGFELVPTGQLYFTGTQYLTSNVLVKRPKKAKVKS